MDLLHTFSKLPSCDNGLKSPFTTGMEEGHTHSSMTFSACPWLRSMVKCKQSEAVELTTIGSSLSSDLPVKLKCCRLCANVATSYRGKSGEA